MATINIIKEYQDGQILTEQQLDNAFDSISEFINAGLIGSDNIQDNSIGAAELQTSSVTETKLATDAVTTNKILDGSVTRAKLASALQNLLIVPGTVQAYGGLTAPSGWVLCDGTALNRTTYADLFSVIGVSFGGGDGTTTFNVPDLRGRFIRMVDGTAGRDPDSAARTAMNTGGAVGNNIGSVQLDQFASHTHPQYYISSGGGTQYGAQSGLISGGTQPSVLANGGNETRPKNANLNYMIKT